MTTTTKAKTTVKKTAPKPKVAEAPIPDLPANPFVFEILNIVVKQRSNAKKIEALQKFEHPCLKAIFIWNFDESIVSALPPGDVPYAAVDEMDSFKGTLSEKITDAVEKMGELGSNSLGSQDQGRSSIRKEYTKFYNFVKGGNDGLSSMRRETMFINTLQGLHPLEAEILCLVKDKKLDTKYKITKEIISQAYPDIQWGGRS
ncbi:hypothetical protein PQC13_gp015 [Synechococcus phage S-SRM01]|uniref:Uncharacterized protein n=1 Tax=Synechococcus phage S-SRM01 TaxID=2781608 RepID=A0A879R3R3_9CAUD|nr:hypothetical protein PQC13_gp015 [Synechococcus phage S-SRM01]QPX47980.1 hypothetical protein [Synechococcus phage S-SRM01]